MFTSHMTYAFVFLITGAICGLLGFAAEPSAPAYAGRGLFVIFLVLFIVAYVMGWQLPV
ncbi:MAG TPA: hypothetical protein VKV28_05420 [Candidatus Binataceae bacterium]|nr:hypothetical protein [Candidatus Binataceae bacterium]